MRHKTPLHGSRRSATLRLAAYLAGFFLGFFPIFESVASGANVSDPTRPPAELLPPGSVSDRESPASEAPRVQSVKIGKSAKFAVIDGVVVREGEAFNQMKVVRIHHQGVELKGDSGSVSLSINPSVSKTERKSPQKATN